MSEPYIFTYQSKMFNKATPEIVGKSVAKSVVKSVGQIVAETVTKQMWIAFRTHTQVGGL